MTDDQTPAEVVELVPTTEPDPYPRLTLAQRKQLIATLPWIAAMDPNTEWQSRCRKMVGSAPRRAQDLRYRLERDLLSLDEREVVAPYLCGSWARYVYVTLDNRVLRVCYPHASYYLGASMDEHERYRAWVDAHPMEP